MTRYMPPPSGFANGLSAMTLQSMRNPRVWGYLPGLLGRLAACAIAASLLAMGSGVQANDLDSKKPLDHSDYDIWNTVRADSISADGKWIAYTISSEESGSTLKIRNTHDATEYTVTRGSGAQFTRDGQFIAYYVDPDPDVVKKLRQQKNKEVPRRKLEILNLENGSHAVVERVRAFSFPRENSEWIAIHLLKPADEGSVQEGQADVSESFEVTEQGLKRPETDPRKLRYREKLKQQEATEGKREEQSASGEVQSGAAAASAGADPAQKENKSDDNEKDNGTDLVLRNLQTQVERRFPNVTSLTWSEGAESLAFATSADDPEDDGVFLFDIKRLKLRQVSAGRGNYRQLALSQDGSHLAFLSDRDDYQADEPAWKLYLYKKSQKQARDIVDAETPGVPQDFWPANNAGTSFSEDNRRLYFSTAPIPDDLGEDDKDKKGDKNEEQVDEEPQADVDIWHWEDPYLQPQQLLQANRERNRTYRAVYDLRSRKIHQLETLEVPDVRVDVRSQSDFVVGSSNLKYRKRLSWDVPGYQDTYLINLKTGHRDLITEQARFSASISPEGKYLTWYDPEARHWFGMSTKERKIRNLSQAIPHPLYDELHDTPSLPRSYRSAGWLADDAGLIVYDRYDLWLLHPEGKQKPQNLTGGVGRQTKTRFRYTRLDVEERSIDPQHPMLLSAFDETTKADGYYRLNIQQLGLGKRRSSANKQPKTDAPRLEKLIVLNERLGGLRKARDADDVMLTRQTFERFPDIWHSTLAFQKINRISKANPQQRDYRWGTVEMVNWKSAQGVPLEGLLYKPEGFDPAQEYPLMVYFYERNSDNLHRYYTPAAGRSIINFSFYVSRGYVIFVPDIPYRTGEPGQSAADAVLPGVESILEQGFVDRQRIGVQGHSWGGYQIAWLVTQTDLFACAEAGAPVSNMTSAYGGIRWGSGMSRMFQYERTQSRIGASLWEARDKYIDNSPVFFADRVQTPLLILHNDEDTAVPWYQGIELFVAMRRLGKPCWMLNYPGEPHWVMKDANRMDFAIRLQQFFDHYLKGDPMPVWMADGVPAVDKGKEFGLEYAVEESELESKEESEEESKEE